VYRSLTWDDPGAKDETEERSDKPIKRARRAVRRVRVPERPPYGERFYEAVADAYRACVAAELPPGPTLAEAQGVPVTQAHHWIRSARSRGLLAAGQSGKTG
jgi:hypothetical protein